LLGTSSDVGAAPKKLLHLLYRLICSHQVIKSTQPSVKQEKINILRVCA